MIAAVVPMKPFARAKQRLSGVLSEQDRLALVRTMLGDVLHVIRGCQLIEEMFVVTADAEVADYAARHGAEHIGERDPAGLNGAVAAAARALETRGVANMLVVPGDVPLVTTAEIGELVSVVRSGGAVIAPAHDMDGTNALLLSPPGVIAPAFGPGSFVRHREAARDAGFEPVVCPLKGLGRDIDDDADLRILVKKAVGRPEYAFLRAALTTENQKEPQDA